MHCSNDNKPPIATSLACYSQPTPALRRRLPTTAASSADHSAVAATSGTAPAKSAANATVIAAHGTSNAVICRGARGDISPGSSCDGSLLRQAVAIALVAAKRRRVQQVGLVSAGGANPETSGLESTQMLRARMQQLEMEVTRMRGAAAGLMAAIGRTRPGEVPAVPLENVDRATHVERSYEPRTSCLHGMNTGVGCSPTSTDMAVQAMQALLLSLMIPPESAMVHAPLLDSEVGDISAAGIVSLDREQSLLQGVRRNQIPDSAAAAAAVTGAAADPSALVVQHRASNVSAGLASAADSTSLKAAGLSQVLKAVQSLAELSAAAAASGGGSGSNNVNSLRAAEGPAGLHATALRQGGTKPHVAVLELIEVLLVGSGGGACGVTAAAAAALAPDMRRAYLRHAVQLLAAVIHSLASAACTTAAAAAVAARPGDGRSIQQPVAGSAKLGAVPSGGTRTDETPVTAAAAAAVAAAAAAREQLLIVVLDVSRAVDRLLDSATSAATGCTAAATAIAAVQALEEMLAVPSLGQHVLVCAAQKIRDLGYMLVETAAAGEVEQERQSLLVRQATAATAFNRAQPLFHLLADCSSRLPAWCSLVTAMPKPSDIGPDYLTSHVQALLAAHTPTDTNHDQVKCMRQLEASPCRTFPLYGIAVRECLASTAAALMAVASGGADFVGCGLVQHCRGLCARIKQSALLPH